MLFLFAFVEFLVLFWCLKPKQATMKTKELVKLRQRVMPSGRTSLYLDYTINGKRNYEYLKLYLEKGNTAEIRSHNAQTLRYAEAIRAQRLLEVRNMRFGLEPTQSPDTLFFPIFDGLNKNVDTGTRYTKNTTRTHLLNFSHENLTFREINHRWVEKFERYLQQGGLQKSSISTYMGNLNTVLNFAVKAGIILKNPMAHVVKFHRAESVRSFLTLEELQQLAATPIKLRHDQIRRAFLFSCLTGLRVSDIKALTWGDVSKIGNITRITFKQKKTQSLQYLDINEQAVELMGEVGKASEHIFYISSLNYANMLLRKWVASAGIDKYISFHSGRHTFAVMMLDLGADIYTVQKLLGHRNINTTQIYAKILDKNKQEAVQRIPKIMI